MKSITVKTIFFALVLLFALSSCTDKGKTASPEAQTSDSSAKAKEDSTDAAELKETKEALDAVRK